ncbi:hypothetical protein BgiBS90_004653, partial [Biomphalaria glabrata]
SKTYPMKMVDIRKSTTTTGSSEMKSSIPTGSSAKNPSKTTDLETKHEGGMKVLAIASSMKVFSVYHFNHTESESEGTGEVYCGI